MVFQKSPGRWCCSFPEPTPKIASSWGHGVHLSKIQIFIWCLKKNTSTRAYVYDFSICMCIPLYIPFVQHGPMYIPVIWIGRICMCISIRTGTHYVCVSWHGSLRMANTCLSCHDTSRMYVSTLVEVPIAVEALYLVACRNWKLMHSHDITTLCSTVCANMCKLCRVSIITTPVHKTSYLHIEIDTTCRTESSTHSKPPSRKFISAFNHFNIHKSNTLHAHKKNTTSPTGSWWNPVLVVANRMAERENTKVGASVKAKLESSGGGFRSPQKKYTKMNQRVQEDVIDWTTNLKNIHLDMLSFPTLGNCICFCHGFLSHVQNQVPIFRYFSGSKAKANPMFQVGLSQHTRLIPGKWAWDGQWFGILEILARNLKSFHRDSYHANIRNSVVLPFSDWQCNSSLKKTSKVCYALFESGKIMILCKKKCLKYMPGHARYISQPRYMRQNPYYSAVIVKLSFF